jgi:hypothetical protein
MSFSKTLSALREYDYTTVMIFACVGYILLGIVILVILFHYPDGAGILPAFLALLIGAAFSIHYWISSAVREQNEQEIWANYFRDRTAFIANYKLNHADASYPLEEALKGFDMINKPFYI